MRIHKGRRRGRGTGGFTLLEMMLVVVIIGLLATVAVYNIAGQGTKARIGRTKASLGIIKQALTTYFTDKGSYPPTLQTLALQSGELESVPKDGWKHDFIYFTPTAEAGRPYTLKSPGPDSQPNTPDDVNVWTMDND